MVEDARRTPINTTDKVFFPPDNYIMFWDRYSGCVVSEKNWLENAIELNVYASSSVRIGALVNRVFDEVSKKIKISNKSRTKEAIKTILINLWIGKQMDAPIRYSRNKNNYVSDSRYGKLFFKYSRLIPVIDALEDLGYIHKKTGVYNKEKSFGWQSRMWGTYKLWNDFTTYGLYTPTFFNKSNPEELIILKDKKEDKTKIGYRETKQTQQWREDLIQYNNYIKKHKIYVKLNREIIVNNRFLLQYLFSKIIKSKITIQTVILNNNITKHKKYPLLNIYNKKYDILEIFNNKYNSNNKQPSMTNTFPSNSFLDKSLQHICGRSFLEFWFLPKLGSEFGKCKSQEERDAFLSVEYVLEGLGFERIIFRLNYEYLHRVFNRKSFQYGGRAYGALHQNLPKNMRPFIHINGEKTVEIDYSAYHIRMLYNKKDIDYTDDPYSVCEGPEMRAIYKAVGLIAINAKKNEACGAIRDELKNRKLVAPQRNERFKTLLRKFRDTHKPIEQYLFSGIGLTLQNIDSHIMNAILMSLMDKGILGLSVFDSVIVAEKHEAFTKEVMTEEYKNVMDFKPRF